MMRQIESVCVAAMLVLAAAGTANAEETAPPAEEPARLWMTGSVDRPPPGYQHDQMQLYHGDHLISVPEFVRIAGYDELADRLERRTRNRRLVMLGGLTVAVAGAVVGFTAPKCNDVPAEPECEATRADRQHLGLGIFVVGAATIGAAKLFLPDLRPALHVMRKMETDYNKRLRVTPVVSATGASVHATLSF
ncbi:MAG TPA: hypothetical protein VM261_27345 [Kofleriaceae bacterium]|nr:hypothetical protein [Kofleriaceae bacterium]